MPLDMSKMPTVGEKLEVKRKFDDENKEDERLTYVIKELLGAGTFGAVFKAQCEQDNTMVAVKCEPLDAKHPMLKKEFKVMRAIHSSGSPYTTAYLEKGRLQDRCIFITMQLVGKSLWDLLREREGGAGFSISTAVRLGIQTLAGLRDLHKVWYLHRDVKTQNFAVGLRETDRDSIIFMLDFGMARLFRNHDETLKRRRDRDSDLPFKGTNRYASLACHEGKEQSRKDDIESWFYMMLELTTGTVPWPNMKREQSYKKKLSFRSKAEFDEFMRQAHSVKAEYRRILDYCDQMDFYSRPDYHTLHRLLTGILERRSVREHEALDFSPTRYYQAPDWSMDLYIKKKDRYKEMKKTPTISESSSKCARKDSSVNETATAATATGIRTDERQKKTEENEKKAEEKKEQERKEIEKKESEKRKVESGERVTKRKDSEKKERPKTDKATSKASASPLTHNKDSRKGVKDTTGTGAKGNTPSGKRNVK